MTGMKKLIVSRGKKNQKLEDFSEQETKEHLLFSTEQKTKEDFLTLIEKRNIERGSVELQLEFIAENGIEAWRAREYEIRKKHPKPGQKKPNMVKVSESKPKITEKIANLVKPSQASDQ